MERSLLDSIGFDSPKKKIGLVLGICVLLFAIMTIYLLYSNKEVQEPEKPVVRNVSDGSLKRLLEKHEISILEVIENSSVILPFSHEIETGPSWIYLHTACLRDGFDLRSFENTNVSITTYLINEVDISRRPVYLSVFSVNKTIVCAYKFVEGKPEYKYGLSQPIETQSS